MGRNVTNVFGLNLHRLRKDAYPDWSFLVPVSFRSSYTKQNDQPTRFYSNVCFDDVSCPKGQILACWVSIARSLTRA